MANIIEITDFEAPELDVFTRLTENQLLTGTSRKKEYLLPRARRLLSGLWLQAAVRQPFWRKKEESGEKPGRSWSGSRSFRFSQRSLRFSPK